MAAPNIAAPTAVTGRTATQAVGTGAVAIVTNAAGSGLALRITALYVANVDGTDTPTVNIEHYRGSTARKLAQGIEVPPGQPLVAIGRDAPLWLEEGDSLRLSASTAGDLEAVCSYDEVA